MSKSEAVIGARIKEFRERIEWPQSVFAHEVGVTRNKLASIEYGTTPLRYGLAARICKRYNISRLWLAKGVGSPQSGWDLGKDIEDKVPHKMLFSQAFSRILEPAMPDELVAFLTLDEMTGATQIILPPTNVPLGRHLESFVTKTFLAVSASVPADKRAAFSDAVMETINHLGKAFSSNPKAQVPLRASGAKVDERNKAAAPIRPATGKSGIKGGKDILDNKPDSIIVPGMRLEVPSWLQLKKDIARLTAKRGQRAALADELGVSRQAFGNWLSDDNQGAPNADLTLRLLKWVNDPKRKTK